MAYMDETKNVKNHPKLKKLSEILNVFFTDEKNSKSKVIVFS